MKTVLQLIAHPDITGNSFTGRLAKAFADGCSTHSKVVSINIYDPQAPSTDELKQLILQADHIAFAWPCWWEMPPAKMVDLLQTVFVKGFAFDSDGDKMVPLFQRNATVLISMGQRKTYETTNLREAMTYCGLIPKFAVFSNVGPRLSPDEAADYLSLAHRLGTQAT